jgi:hypothetical protein
MKTTLRITLTDDELIMKVRAIPKSERGRIIQRALKVYFETTGGQEVYAVFAKGKTYAKPGIRKNTLSPGRPSGMLKDVLGEF